MRLDGKTVLLTGASGGIGLATLRELVGQGASVVAHWGRNQAPVLEAVKDLPEGRILMVQSDFSRDSGPAQLWDAAVDWTGRVDVLVSNAAVMPEAGFAASDEVWDDAMASAMLLNVTQPMRLIRSAVNHFRDNGGGVLITLSSWAGQRGSGNPNLAAYAASKAAITAGTKTVAHNFAKDGILAYCIAPGPVDTQMTRRSAMVLGGLEQVASALAIGELIAPEEIARLVAFLADGRSRHLTGATLDINGATYIR